VSGGNASLQKNGRTYSRKPQKLCKTPERKKNATKYEDSELRGRKTISRRCGGGKDQKTSGGGLPDIHERP